MAHAGHLLKLANTALAARQGERDQQALLVGKRCPCLGRSLCVRSLEEEKALARTRPCADERVREVSELPNEFLAGQLNTEA